jgi:low affinity Fe/Cu permease
VSDWFRRLAHGVSSAVGSSWAFIAAVVIVLVWLITGPFLNYSDHWQLIINTGTTIITFLMVFLIQNAQNRDGRAIHLKLDELIRSVKGARNSLVDLEHCTDEELEKFSREFEQLKARQRSRAEPSNGERAHVHPSSASARSNSSVGDDKTRA